MNKKSIAAVFFLLVLIALLAFSYTPPILPPQEGEILIFSNQTGGNLTKTITNAIDSSRESIAISIFNISDANVISSLNKKAEEGIEIALYTDAKASWHGMKSLHKGIKKHLWKTGALMHQKILIIDKKEVYLGSANFTWNSLNIHRNLILAFKNEEAAIFLLGHLDATDFPKRPLAQSKSIAIGSQEAEILMYPGKTENVIPLIESAKKCIKVAMYTWTRADFATALTLACLRGVDVQAVLDRSVEKCSSVIDTLLKGGIQTHVYQGPGLLHHKFMWIDDEILFSGSANWTKSAFTQNREYTILLKNLTDPQKETMHSLWNSLKKESKLL